MKNSIINRQFFDLKNSIFWFFMDANWLFGFEQTAVICWLVAILAGSLTVLLSKDREDVMFSMANLSWVFVNFFWLLAEMQAMDDGLLAAKVCFFIGITFLILSLGKTPVTKLRLFTSFKSKFKE